MRQEPPGRSGRVPAHGARSPYRTRTNTQLVNSACDFFTKWVITKRGFVDLYVLLFMHLDTQEVFVTAATTHPNSAWVAQQARNFLMHVADRQVKPTHLLHDRDTKFTRQFETICRCVSSTHRW